MKERQKMKMPEKIEIEYENSEDKKSMEMINRLRKVIMWWIIIVTVGILTAWFLIINDMFLPCPFRAVTGWLCPGCGATRMCLSILKLDFYSAYSFNKVLFLLTPLIIFMIILSCFRYVKIGVLGPGEKGEKASYLIVGILLVYGVLRNIF